MVRPSLAAVPVFRMAQLAYLLLVFMLIFMKQRVMIQELGAVPADFLFVLVMALWVLSLATRQTVARWHQAFWILPAYLAALGASALVSTDTAASAFKLSTQFYLVALAFLTYNLVRTVDDLKQVFITWLAASAFLGAWAVATVILFPILGPDSILAGPLHHYGTLPPGPYPRIELTFVHPAMLANYLTVSLLILFISARLRWVRGPAVTLIAISIVVAAFFALTPGFGGLLLGAGIWTGLLAPGRKLPQARVALAGGIIGGVAFTLAAVVTPIVPADTPFLIDLPGLPPLAPSVRLLAWMDALRNFWNSPLLGGGIGIPPVHVPYTHPSGDSGYVNDAHNTYLNIAAQCGVAGLLGVLMLLIVAVRMGRPFKGARRNMKLLRAGLATAFLSAFGFEGLVGSFEDARHLWVLFGLIAVASNLALRPQSTKSDADRISGSLCWRRSDPSPSA